MRHVIAHASVLDELVDRISGAYGRLPIGNPLESGTLVGPLIHEAAYRDMQSTLEAVTNEGGSLVVGGRRRLKDEAPQAFCAEPAIVRIDSRRISSVVRASHRSCT